MDQNFIEFRNHVKSVLGDIRPDCQTVADDVMKYWQDCHERDVEALDFANALIEIAFDVMLYYDTLEESQIFSEDIRDKSKRAIASISEYWPPVDHSKWPKDILP